jgi:pterin-4a-carbinolamine dehydratase
MLGKAFISYRRSDTEWVAQSLYQQLRSRFGPGQLFMDVNAIEPGSRWPERLRDELAASTILVVLIGSRWLSATDRYWRRRLDDPGDWVRRELKVALEENKRVLVIQVDDASLPPAEALPKPLAGLASIQSTHRLHAASWSSDINAIELLLASWGLRDDEPGPLATPQPEPSKRNLPPISETELAERLRELPHWEPWKDALPREHPKIRQELRRSYEFESFEEAIAFMSALAPRFTEWNHHPRWSNEWKTLYVRLSTWDAYNRITAVDLAVAAKVDLAYRRFVASRPQVT